MAIVNTTSSAPHLGPADAVGNLVDWGVQPDSLEGQSHSSGILLWKNDQGTSESGLWVCSPGRWRLTLPRDELCHFIQGRATYRNDDGEIIEVSAGTVVHFKQGWTGACQIYETLRNVYMLC